MILCAILAAASAWLVTRKAPQHRPLAWALTVCAVLDAVRLFELPARVDMALCLGVPAVSAWAYTIAFDPNDLAPMVAPVVIIAVGLAMLWSGPWEAILVVAYCGVFFVAATAWLNGSRLMTISQRVALILLAGDMLAVASLCAREWVHWQAGVLLAAVTVYQLVWYWRWTNGN